jgi:hypothetical protein
MIPAGRWQAVKDTLSRPNGRSLTTSDAFGNTTTITVYSNFITIPLRNSWYNSQFFYYTLMIQQLTYAMTLLLQQPKLLSTNWHNNLYITTLDTATTLSLYCDHTIDPSQHVKIHYPIQQSLCCDTWYSNLAYYSTTIVTANFLMILWYSWYKT